MAAVPTTGYQVWRDLLENENYDDLRAQKPQIEAAAADQQAQVFKTAALAMGGLFLAVTPYFGTTINVIGGFGVAVAMSIAGGDNREAIVLHNLHALISSEDTSSENTQALAGRTLTQLNRLTAGDPSGPAASE